jgi:hypothetical protein
MNAVDGCKAAPRSRELRLVSLVSFSLSFGGESCCFVVNIGS